MKANRLKYYLLICAVLGAGLCQLTCAKKIDSKTRSYTGIHYLTGSENDKVRSVEKTRDGGFIYAGVTGNDSSDYNGFLMKVNSDGHLEWYKQYGGKLYDEFKNAIQSSDGGYIAVGQTNSIGAGINDSTLKFYDYWVKVSATGELEWEKSFSLGSADSRSAFLTTVKESPSNVFYATGGTFSDNTALNVILGKVDALGNKIYLRMYNSLSNYPPGLILKSWNESGTGICFSKSGDVMLGGVMNPSDLSSETGIFNSFLIAARESNGGVKYFYPYYDFIRGSQYNYTTGIYFTTPVKVFEVTDGFLLATYFEDRVTGAISIQFLKTDFAGNLQWEKKNQVLGNALLNYAEMDVDGNIIIAGATSDKPLAVSMPEAFINLKPFVMAFDIQANEKWRTIVDCAFNNHIVKCVNVLSNGDLFLAGNTTVLKNGFDKPFCMKVNRKGEILNN